MKKALSLLLAVLVVMPLAGCGSKEDEFDPNKIAVKQPGDGPPPMTPPGGSPAQQPGGTTK